MRFRAWASIFILLQNGVLAAPKIVCQNSEWKFGTVGRDELLRHTFVIENQGDSELRIKKVQMCCGASHKLAGTTIAPGTNTTLDVSLLLTGRSGQLRKNIYILSNDPRQPYYALRLSGNVVVAVELIPSSLQFKCEREAAIAAKQVKVVSRGTTLAVTNVVSTSPYFSARLVAPESGSANLIEVQTVAPLVGGVTRGHLDIFTDHPKHSHLSVDVTVTVPSDFVVVPNGIAVKENKGGMPVSRTIAIRSRNKKPFKIVDIALPDSSITKNVEPLGEHGYKVMLASIPPSAELAGKSIIINTDLGRGSSIAVPFRVPQPSKKGGCCPKSDNASKKNSGK
ncbi:DUF1573 domain-containing protein [Verrucomicrobiota bacterium]